MLKARRGKMRRGWLTPALPAHIPPPSQGTALSPRPSTRSGQTMKIRNSLKTAKVRDKNCVLVRRRGRMYVINKKNPRLKARQG